MRPIKRRLDRWVQSRGPFAADACRWIRPEEVAAPEELTFVKLLGLLRTHLPLRAIAWFRVSGWLARRSVPVLPTLIQHHLLHAYGLEMAPRIVVEGGLYIAHPVGCTVQAEWIGRNVTIIGPVTIGYRSVARWPRIADGAYIGTGARVLGDLRVGEGARVGANAVVLETVPPHTTVVGMPARPVRSAESSAG
jgi:serine O-acetyltransferase